MCACVNPAQCAALPSLGSSPTKVYLLPWPPFKKFYQFPTEGERAVGATRKVHRRHETHIFYIMYFMHIGATVYTIQLIYFSTQTSQNYDANGQCLKMCKLFE
jgi:hypothetical protein